MPKSNFTREPVVCAVCMREATGIGYAPRMGAPIAWLCDDPQCTPLGRVVHHMATKDLSFHEAIALSDAGDKAGEFLETIGKTDLASLDREEWLKFLKTVLESYAQNMRDRLLNHAAPF